MGAVERLNRTIIGKLASISNGTWKNWDDKLPWALYSYRIAPIMRLKSSPFELLYGRRPSTISNYEISETGENFNKIENKEEEIIND